MYPTPTLNPAPNLQFNFNNIKTTFDNVTEFIAQ